MTRKAFTAGAVVVAAITGALGYQSLASSTASSTADVLHDERQGAMPEGTSVFADDVPGVTNLDPALLDALRRAGTAAARDGFELVVQSGWRSSAYQAHLLREAVAEYGSVEEAARWVASPAASAHVSGDAVDVGPAAATTWLSEHGAAYGLCRVYANERWHFELRPDAVARGCPPLYADAAHDPRRPR
jgi:LAS superfamily LD-carboxypeptidase LdcB